MHEHRIQGSTQCFPGGFGRGYAQFAGDVLVARADLEAQQKTLTDTLVEPRQRTLVQLLTLQHFRDVAPIGVRGRPERGRPCRRGSATLKRASGPIRRVSSAVFAARLGVDDGRSARSWSRRAGGCSLDMSSGRLQFDDRQVSAAVEVTQHQFEPNARTASTIPGVAKPPSSGLVSRCLARRGKTAVHLRRRSSVEARVGPLLVVPDCVARELTAHLLQTEGHDDPPRTLGLHRPDEPLDHGDAPVPSDRSKPRPDAASSAPALERPAEELLAFVGDDVAGRRSGLPDGSSEERADVDGARPRLEEREANELPRRMVHGDGRPPAERPPLDPGEREPRRPESCGRRDGGQVHVPDVVRLWGCESCHGPGGLHLQDPRGYGMIRKPSRELCMVCHTENHSRLPFVAFHTYLKDVVH